MVAAFLISLTIFFIVHVPSILMNRSKRKINSAGSLQGYPDFITPAFINKTIAKEQLAEIIASPRDIQPIFGMRKGGGLSDGISMITPYQEWLFAIDEVTDSFREEVSIILYQLYDLGERLGLQFQIIDERAVLSHWAWYDNFDMGGFMLAEFEASFSLDWNKYGYCDEHEPRKAGLEYSILARLEIEYEAEGEPVGKTFIDIYKEAHEVIGFGQIRSAAKLFVKAFREACVHAAINVDSNLLCDLEECRDNNPQQIYEITYLDKNDKCYQDRICDLHYSIYSPRSQSEIKWIYAFSESAGKFCNFKVKNFQRCKPKLPFS